MGAQRIEFGIRLNLLADPCVFSPQRRQENKGCGFGVLRYIEVEDGGWAFHGDGNFCSHALMAAVYNRQYDPAINLAGNINPHSSSKKPIPVLCFHIPCSKLMLPCSRSRNLQSPTQSSHTPTENTIPHSSSKKPIPVPSCQSSWYAAWDENN